MLKEMNAQLSDAVPRLLLKVPSSDSIRMVIINMLL